MSEENTQSKPNIFLTRKEDQELRIYFFIGQKNVMQVTPFTPPKIEQRIIYVTGFKLEEVFEVAKKKASGFNLLFTAQSPTIREFLRELELESLAHEALAKTKEIPVEKKEPAEIELAPVQMNFEQFKAGLLYCANEADIIYQNPKDKETLKQIISGLNHKEIIELKGKKESHPT